MDRPTVRLDVSPVGLPLALAEVHAALAPGTPVALVVSAGWRADALADVVTGAGFAVEAVEADDRSMRATATRARTLSDTVGPDMRLLVCGLNPSIFSADHGVGYARPGNRFWPAALDADLVSRDRDALHALTAHGIGLTDLVKRATVGAGELTPDEYRAGAGRVERLVRWLEPAAACFVGLAGWRAAVDRRATPGPQNEPFGGRPAYVMPSTSGLNARTPRAELARHLAAAAALGR